MNITKPRLDQFKITGSTVGDVHFPKVKWLSPFNGSNGATTTTDSSNSNLSLTLGSSTVISTAQSKFGGSSLYVPNSATQGVYANGAGSTIQLTADFTLEWWVYRVQVSYANNMAQLLYGVPLSSLIEGAGSYGLLVGYYGSSVSTTQSLLYASSNGSSWNVASAVQLGTGSLGTVGQWVHMALVRSGTTWSYYVDGTRTYTGTLGSDTLSTPGSYMYLGRAWSNVSSMEAYYDDFRVTQGLARYTGASFTPPTTAHLTSAGDVNKHIVVNSDADGVAIGTGGINQARVAKAWLNYDGTTPSIRDSYNIGSVTDRGTGEYTINYSTAMSDTNYSIVGFAHDDASSAWWRSLQSNGGAAQAAGSFAIEIIHPQDYSYQDSDTVCIQVFGN